MWFRRVLWKWRMQVFGRFPDKSFLEQIFQTLWQKRWQYFENLLISSVQSLSYLLRDNWTQRSMQAHGMHFMYFEILLGVPECEQKRKLDVRKLQRVLWKGGPDPEADKLLNKMILISQYHNNINYHSILNSILIVSLTFLILWSIFIFYLYIFKI